MTAQMDMPVNSRRIDLDIKSAISEQLAEKARSTYQSMKDYKNLLLLNKLQHDLGISRASAELLFDDVKRFIALCAASPEPLGLSKIIDQAWHTFILITREYARFCQEHCGRYIHHEPSDPFGAGKDYLAARAKTFDLAMTVFGSLSENWSEPAGNCTHNCTNGD